MMMMMLVMLYSNVVYIYIENVQAPLYFSCGLKIFDAFVDVSDNTLRCASLNAQCMFNVDYTMQLVVLIE